MMRRFPGKTAFVTGAGAGIGRAAAKRFAIEGANVVVADIRTEAVESVCDEIRSAGGSAIGITTDVKDEQSVQQAFAKTKADFGGLDILFNCAGGSLKNDAPVTEVDMSVWDFTIGVNLLGTFLCCRSAIPLLIERGGGVIVNTSSWAALSGTLRKHVYAAAKGGIISLTRAIAGEYSKHQIRANVLCPGSVRTERWKENATVQPQLQELAEKYPFSRGEPDEMAAIALFLASDEARMMTGAVVTADGGRTAF